MSKPVLVAGALVALAAGCVSVAGPSAAPSTTPRPATPTPSATPTAAPTVAPTPTLAPTVAPTATAEPTATSGPTPQPTGDLGFDQRDVIFYDDLADTTDHCTTGPQSSPAVYPDDCWGVGTTDGGTIAYTDGMLSFDTTANGAWMWSRRVAKSTNATMRVIGDFIPSGDGRFGVLCASGDANLYGAVVGTDGSWAFVAIGGSGGAQVLLDDQSAGLAVQQGSSNLVALECAGTVTGDLRLTLWLNKSGPVATYVNATGPATFDRAATYVESAGDTFTVDMDNIILFGSRISDGSLSPEGEALLAHVPAAWQSSCYQGLRPPYLASTADAVLTCFLPTHDGAEIAEYAAFSTADAMTAAYQSRIDAFGSGDAVNSCADGSGEHSYNISDTEAGRLLCVDQFVGIRFDWTDTRLNIMSTLVDFDGSYGATFADWQVGGPDL